jgi:hypothetical protein
MPAAAWRSGCCVDPRPKSIKCEQGSELQRRRRAGRRRGSATCAGRGAADRPRRLQARVWRLRMRPRRADLRDADLPALRVCGERSTKPKKPVGGSKLRHPASSSSVPIRQSRLRSAPVAPLRGALFECAGGVRIPAAGFAWWSWPTCRGSSSASSPSLHYSATKDQGGPSGNLCAVTGWKR